MLHGSTWDEKHSRLWRREGGMLLLLLLLLLLDSSHTPTERPGEGGREGEALGFSTPSLGYT